MSSSNVYFTLFIYLFIYLLKVAQQRFCWRIEFRRQNISGKLFATLRKRSPFCFMLKTLLESWTEKEAADVMELSKQSQKA